MAPVNFGDPRMPDRFWSKVSPCPISGCWIWTAAHNGRGYGQFDNRGAHRVAYERLIGAILVGLELDHKCRVSFCVNPKHLEPVTHVDNVRSSPWNKPGGRGGFQKTHCTNGHEFTPENSYIRGARRHCKKCMKSSYGEWYARNHGRKASR